MLLQDVKEIKNGRIISGQKELVLDSKTNDDWRKGYNIITKRLAGIDQYYWFAYANKGEHQLQARGVTEEEALNKIKEQVKKYGKDSKTKDVSPLEILEEVWASIPYSKTKKITEHRVGSNAGLEEMKEFVQKAQARGVSNSLIQKFLFNDSKTKDGTRPSDDIVAKWKPKAPGNLRNHPMWNPVDYAYFRNKGDSDEQIKIFWERDYKRGKGPVTWERDSKSTKDQIAELESQKEEAKKKGYGTDAYDAKIKSLQKDAFSQPLTVEEIKSLFQNIDPMYAKMLSGVVTSKQMAVRKGLEVGLKLSSEGARFKDSVDSSDIFTQDPLTEKGKEILASMKEQYGDEEGEKIFYASKNKGTISGVDSYDPTQPKNIAAAKKLSVAQGKAATGDAPAPKEFDYLKDWQNAAMERGYRLQNSLQRGMWVAYQGNREMGTFVRTRGGKLYLDSKTKDANDIWAVVFENTVMATYPTESQARNFINRLHGTREDKQGYYVKQVDPKIKQGDRVRDSKTKDASRSEQAYDEGYEAALQGKPFTANPYKDVSRSGYADLKESWEDGYRDGRSSKSSKDSKTKDDLEEEIKKMAREKADRPFNDDGTIRTPQQAQLAYEQWYKIIKSRYKNDSRYKDSKTKDFKAKRPGWYVVNNNDEPIEGPFNEIKCKQRAKELGMDYVYITDYDLHRSNDSDIIINVVENPNEEVESEEEAFDLVHYNGYNIKLVKETGEYDIYDVGGAMIGHTATLELAKLFVDNKGNATIVYE